MAYSTPDTDKSTQGSLLCTTEAENLPDPVHSIFKKRRLTYETQCTKSVKRKNHQHQPGAVNSIVSIDIGGGNIITATISCAAVEELGLKVGSDAYAVIKATNVMVGIDE